MPRAYWLAWRTYRHGYADWAIGRNRCGEPTSRKEMGVCAHWAFRVSRIVWCRIASAKSCRLGAGVSGLLLWLSPRTQRA